MGNVFCKNIETDPRDMQNKEILEARKRYLDEQFIQDVEKEPEKATPDAIENTGVNRKLRKLPSVLNEIEMKATSINPKDHSYPFENLVFEGGGAKGHAYSGAVMALEELGIVSQVKRFAGTSAGAMTASLLAVGYDSKAIQGFLSQDLSLILFDAKCGILSLLPNLLTGYGWNPANRFYNWFGELLEKKMGNKNVTSTSIIKTGLELCIIVANVNHMREEYCHVKTTPYMPIRIAVRMSMAVPGLFQATHYTYNGETNMYVDGGLICNYPIHCFDETVPRCSESVKYKCLTASIGYSLKYRKQKKSKAFIAFLFTILNFKCMNNELEDGKEKQGRGSSTVSKFDKQPQLKNIIE